MPGRRYKGLEESFADGSIFRMNAPNAGSGLRMLIGGRVDVMTAPASQLKHQVAEIGIADPLYFAPKPLFSCRRHLIVTRALRVHPAERTGPRGSLSPPRLLNFSPASPVRS